MKSVFKFLLVWLVFVGNIDVANASGCLDSLDRKIPAIEEITGLMLDAQFSKLMTLMDIGNQMTQA